MAFLDKFLFRMVPAPSVVNRALTQWSGYLDDVNEQIVIFDNATNTELFRIGGGNLPFGNDTGVADAYQTAIVGASLTDGYAFEIKIANTNTGPSTLQINALGALPFVDGEGNPLNAGDLDAGSIYIAAYNSTFNAYQLLGLAKPGVGITNNVIPKGTGASITDGAWEFLGNDILPSINGSNIGDATHRIGTIFMASTFDYASDLTWVSVAETMRLSTTGNLGIGVTPTARLHVQGVDATAANYALKVDNVASSPLVYVQNDGNVGIGTSMPSQRLHINGTTRIEDTVFIANDGFLTFSAGTNVSLMALSGRYLSLRSVDQYIEFMTNGVARMTVKATGTINADGLQVGNAGLLSGDLYVDSAANILANGDLVVGRKV